MSLREWKEVQVLLRVPVATPLEDFVATARVGDTLNVYGSKMLVNRVDREACAIAKDFDELCRDHLADIKEIYSLVVSLLHFGLTQAKKHDDKVRSELGTVLSNALENPSPLLMRCCAPDGGSSLTCACETPSKFSALQFM